MAAEMKDLETRKRELVARNEACRQALAMEFRDIRTATAWVPHTVHVVRAVYPALLFAIPLIGYLFARRRRIPKPEARAKPGVIGSALAGYRFFRQMKPVWDGLRSGRNH